MVIYDQEKEDGISIKLLTAGSISYASSVVPAEPTDSIKNLLDFCHIETRKAVVLGRLIDLHTEKSANLDLTTRLQKFCNFIRDA